MNTHSRPIVIAHRGASGYLPEHSLAAKALAFAMGADYLEQDVVATRDDELVVLHDIYLDRVSDVAARYPDKARADGRYYVRDFDLEELRTLCLSERFQADGSAVYPDRFPPHTGHFRIHTFAEELDFLRSLNASTGNEVGCYPEIKRPAWHKAEGIDITTEFLRILDRFAYSNSEDRVFIQCFDADELIRIRHDLDCGMCLVQLIGDNNWGEGPTDFDALRTPDGLARLADTVNAIGPWLQQLYRIQEGGVVPTALTSDAHDAGLEVHPYTFRRDELPDGFESFADLLEFSLGTLRIDGMFTDFADIVRWAVDGTATSES